MSSKRLRAKRSELERGSKISTTQYSASHTVLIDYTSREIAEGVVYSRNSRGGATTSIFSRRAPLLSEFYAQLVLLTTSRGSLGNSRYRYGTEVLRVSQSFRKADTLLRTFNKGFHNNLALAFVWENALELITGQNHKLEYETITEQVVP